MLSKCLTMLSIWEDCYELKSISFHYSKSDIKNEHEEINIAARLFRNKFGFIKTLRISQNWY